MARCMWSGLMTSISSTSCDFGSRALQHDEAARMNKYGNHLTPGPAEVSAFRLRSSPPFWLTSSGSLEGCRCRRPDLLAR